MRARLRRWIVPALAVAALIALLLPVFSTLQPDYYRRYPGMSERMDHWAVSTHSRIGCAECHVHPGALGAVTFAAESVPAFYSQLFRGPDETNLLKAPGRDACQKCHTAYRKVAPSGDLLIPHRAHVEVLDMDCVTCHEDMVHSLNRRGFNRPEMEGCLERCHDGDKATDECVKCHTRKHTPVTHESTDWLRTHGTVDDIDECDDCHDWTPDYCADCHAKRPASHVGNWKKGHAAPAAQRGDGCTVCHGGEQFCEECH